MNENEAIAYPEEIGTIADGGEQAVAWLFSWLVEHCLFDDWHRAMVKVSSEDYLIAEKLSRWDGDHLVVGRYRIWLVAVPSETRNPES